MEQEKRFGELRSMLHDALETRAKREKLLRLLVQERQTNRALFDERWLPYVVGRRRAWPEPFATVTSLIEAQRAHELLPGARFRLSLGHLDAEDFNTEAMAQDERLEYICGLLFDGMKLTGEQLAALLQSPHLGALIELDLGHTEVKTLEPLFATTHARTLHLLDLQHTWIKGEDLDRLVEQCPELRVLDVTRCWRTPKQCEALRAGLAHLRHLYTD